MVRGEQHTADVGLARHDTVATNLLRQDVLVTKTVLKRHHDRLRPDDHAAASALCYLLLTVSFQIEGVLIGLRWQWTAGTGLALATMASS